MSVTRTQVPCRPGRGSFPHIESPGMALDLAGSLFRLSPHVFVCSSPPCSVSGWVAAALTSQAPSPSGFWLGLDKGRYQQIRKLEEREAGVFLPVPTLQVAVLAVSIQDHSSHHTALPCFHSSRSHAHVHNGFLPLPAPGLCIPVCFPFLPTPLKIVPSFGS